MLYRIRHQLANIPTTTYITPATRNTQHYNLPYARTDVYKSSFFPSTIKLWNNLQPAIINSTTIPQLRQASCNPHQHPVGAGQHLTLTSIIQLQYTNSLTSGRRGATLSATYMGGHLTFTSIIQLQYIPTHQQPVGVGLHYQLPIWVDTSRLLAITDMLTDRQTDRQTDKTDRQNSNLVSPPSHYAIVNSITPFTSSPSHHLGLQTIIVV